MSCVLCESYTVQNEPDYGATLKMNTVLSVAFLRPWVLTEVLLYKTEPSLKEGTEVGFACCSSSNLKHLAYNFESSDQCKCHLLCYNNVLSSSGA